MRVYLLGPISVTRAGQEVQLSGKLQRVLIAALASEAGKLISAERLIDTLWGDQPPSTARAKLQGHMSTLRKALAIAGPRAVDLTWPLITRSPGYQLSTDGVEVDLLEYQSLVKLAVTELDAGRVLTASDLLRDALALWRGPAFADVRTPIIGGMAAALERGRMLAAERKAECDLRLGRYETAAEDLTSILASYPLREGSRAALMLVLYQRGCRAEALECYRAGLRLSREQLGIEPGSRLRRLHELMLKDDPQLSTQDLFHVGHSTRPTWPAPANAGDLTAAPVRHPLVRPRPAD